MYSLIADSGSTKTEWLLIEKHGEKIISVSTSGINPFYHDTNVIHQAIQKELLPALTNYSVNKIFFYGAGCSQPDKIDIVYTALKKSFPASSIIVAHDLLAAARALCGHSPGIACILGTGSNSCLYDGKHIIDNIPSLGFMLGDEASGAYFGKKLLQAFFYRDLPSDLLKRFEAMYQLQKEDILHRVYTQPNPNRFVASFMPFISDHQHHHFFKKVLYDGFCEFIDKFLLKYEGHSQLPIHFVGSVAWYNRYVLTEALKARGLHLGKIIQKPMEDLAAYHAAYAEL